jgi:DNA-binding response OmpR family regulator
MPFRTLVADVDRTALSATAEILASSGYHVVSAACFEEAKLRLVSAPPDLLVVALRLGPYNGLHLVLRAHADNPSMPAIVIDERPDPDPVLKVEAKNLNAVYMVGRPDKETLVPLIRQLLAGATEPPSSTVERQWPRKPAGFSVSVAGTEAKVVDVSYGGLLLELAGAPYERLSQIDALSIPRAGRIPVRPVWARGDVGALVLCCGVEVIADEPGAARAWRTFVDSFSWT